MKKRPGPISDKINEVSNVYLNNFIVLERLVRQPSKHMVNKCTRECVDFWLHFLPYLLILIFGQIAVSCLLFLPYHITLLSYFQIY